MFTDAETTHPDFDHCPCGDYDQHGQVIADARIKAFANKVQAYMEAVEEYEEVLKSGDFGEDVWAAKGATDYELTGKALKEFVETIK